MCTYSRSRASKGVSEIHHMYLLTVMCNKINELACSIHNTHFPQQYCSHFWGVLAQQQWQNWLRHQPWSPGPMGDAVEPLVMVVLLQPKLFLFSYSLTQALGHHCLHNGWRVFSCMAPIQLDWDLPCNRGTLEGGNLKNSHVERSWSRCTHSDCICIDIDSACYCCIATKIVLASKICL